MIMYKCQETRGCELSLIKEFFTGAEMSALWSRFKSKRKGAPTAVQQAFDGLKRFKPEDDAMKLSSLQKFVLGKDWQTSLVQYNEKQTEEAAKRTRFTPLTYGQLVQQHGQDEV